ncbi:MAG: dihydrofolate reductase [Flavobacteriales bacterium]|nr:dihydrofolate reductase [Flavobacteriales bacterium]MCB9165924.1 dihydrofolate reductase [Flavobacteriales bacterium]
MIVSVIAAMAENGVIGVDGELPWRLPDDMKFFQRTTMGHHVITGRKNYESIPDRFRPLAGRNNVVVTRDHAYAAPGATVVHALEEALHLARNAGETEAFIIGGGQIYAEAFRAGVVDRIYLTVVHAEVDGDVYFPDFQEDAWAHTWNEIHPSDERHAYSFTFHRYERISGSNPLSRAAS